MTTPEPSRERILRISAVLITKDAEAHLRECLESLAWCDEVIVLDSGSTDGTRALIREFRAQLVVDTDWQGFGVQKNRAIAYADGDWVFSIDADEIVTPELRAEILERVASPGDAVAFEMPRRSNFCGHWMRHGGWWPDRVTRLFRSGKARFSDDLVHERLEVAGPVGRLASPLLHYTYDHLEQALAKLDRYSTLGAQAAHARGKRATPLTALARGGWAFFRTYLLRRGFLDGHAGLMLAAYNAQGTYCRYAKLWLLGQGTGVDSKRPSPADGGIPKKAP